jgi:hypothetical protein
MTRRTIRLQGLIARESMIEMANKGRITKVSRVFPRIYAYTAPWEQGRPEVV